MNLKGSSFTDFKVNYLLSVVFIDVTDTNITTLDLRKCFTLLMVVADVHQLIYVNDIVEIVEFTLPSKASDGIHDTR